MITGRSNVSQAKLRRYVVAAQVAIALALALLILDLVFGVAIPFASRNFTDAQRMSLLGLRTGIGGNAYPAVTHAQMWLVGALSTLPQLLLLFGLAQLWRYFAACTRGGPFERQALRYVWLFAIAFVTAAALQIAVQPLVWQVVWLGAAVSAGQAPIRITDTQVLTVLLGAGIFGVAAILSEAARLADDVRGFV